MKNLKRTVILAAGLFIASSAQSQNQFHLTQYMVHQPFINPASMGMFDNMNGSIFYKNQWTGFDGAPKLIGFNFNTPLGTGMKNRVGLTVVNDRIGVNSVTSISGSYAYSIKTGTSSTLSFGLAATLGLRQSDFADVSTTIVDPEFQANTPTLAMPNFKFGAFYKAKNWYVGMSLPNMLKNTIEYTNEFSGATSFDLSDWHFYLHGGYSWAINENLDLNSSTIFKHVSGAPFQVDISTMMVIKKKFGIGVNYRTSKDISGLLRFRLNPMLEMAYAYDYNISDINKFSSGSHEIMIIFDIYNKDKKPDQAMPRY
jgi:type IX secretion system PorP/SprF family membrane protein